MADWSDAIVEWSFKLKTVPTLEENVTSPTLVLPLSMSNLLTSCLRNDFTVPKFPLPILPESSTTKMMSTGQSSGGAGDWTGGGVVTVGTTTRT